MRTGVSLTEIVHSLTDLIHSPIIQIFIKAYTSGEIEILNNAKLIYTKNSKMIEIFARQTMIFFFIELTFPALILVNTLC